MFTRAPLGKRKTGLEERAPRKENPWMTARLGLAKLMLVPTAAFGSAAVALLILAGGDPAVWFYVGYTLAFATLGLLVASRQPDNPMSVIFVTSALLITLQGLVWDYALFGVSEDLGVPAAREAAWIADWTWPLGDFGPALVILFFFPNGRLASHRWRPMAWLAAIGFAVAMVGFALRPGMLQSDDDFSSLENPFGIEGAGAAFLALETLGTCLMAAGVVAAASSLVVRLRRARGSERQQLEWVAFGAAIWATALVVGVAFFSFYPWAGALVNLAPLAIVLATAVAILRYRLFDIEVVVRRTLVYGVVSGLLAGLYFAVVVALQEIFSGVAGGSDLAIAVSTLAAAALFRPVRARVQHLVDRRFYRSRYDAARTVEAFGRRLREEIDLEALNTELREVVDVTMRPAHVSLWLRPREDRR